MENATRKRHAIFYIVIAALAAIITALVIALVVNIFQRKQEAKNPFLKLVNLTENDVDPAKWGINWPREYDQYLRTAEPTATRFGGATVGPEGTLPPEKADRDPWLKRIFAGYLFAVDYRDRRGHAFMLQDQEVTKRNVPSEAKQSGNCLHCHAAIMPFYRKLGEQAAPKATPAEQVMEGLRKVSEMSYWDAFKALGQVTGGPHPVSCVDCHDPKTIELRVTRPGFIDGIRRLATSDDPVPHLPSIERWRRGERKQPYDPNHDGTRQEMRSFVCGQCHVEYYCGKGMTVFFPWNDGLKVEQIERYYDGLQVQGKRFKDWTHAETGIDVLKAQHPEFELWSQGVHARSGVACADCHMPYLRQGAMKVSDHWVRSPLLQVNRSCQVCHPYGDEEIKTRAEGIQARHYALLNRAGQAAVAMINGIVAVRKSRPEWSDLAAWQKAVAQDARLKEMGELQRAAQWRLDFVAAENSMGFHAPQELARILGESIDLSRQAEVDAVAFLGGTKAPGPAASPASPPAGTVMPPAPPAPSGPSKAPPPPAPPPSSPSGRPDGASK